MLNRKDGVEAVVDRLEKEEHDDTAVVLLGAVGRAEVLPETALPSIIGLARKRSATFRRAAFEAIIDLGGRHRAEAIDALAGLVAHEPEGGIRTEAVRALEVLRSGGK